VLRQYSRLGFTLFELLVVIGVIMILASLVFVGFSRSKSSAQDSSARQSLRQLGQAAEMYRSDFGEYPLSPSVLVLRGQVDSRLLGFARDPFPQGLAEEVVRDSYRGMARGAPQLPYKMTPTGFLEWSVQANCRRFSEQAPDGGWLVDLSISELSLPGNPLIFSKGFYRRLLYDGSVQRFPHKDTIQDESGQGGRTPSLLFFTETEEYKNWTEQRGR